jgi:hypothetical protein
LVSHARKRQIEGVLLEGAESVLTEKGESGRRLEKTA